MILFKTVSLSSVAPSVVRRLVRLNKTSLSGVVRELHYIIQCFCHQHRSFSPRSTGSKKRELFFRADFLREERVSLRESSSMRKQSRIFF